MKHSRFLSIAGAIACAVALSACGTLDSQTVGTAGGAALGGIAGHEISDGSTAGTIGGAAIGGVIGNQVTRPR